MLRPVFGVKPKQKTITVILSRDMAGVLKNCMGHILTKYELQYDNNEEYVRCVLKLEELKRHK